MLALITGASSGLGYDFATKLSLNGYDLVLVARNKSKLEELKSKLNTKVTIEIMDLSIKENAYKLYEKYKDNVDLLINNAGFGDLGYFDETSLNNDLNMIDLNIVTPHILTKLFLKNFIKQDEGQILNVSSSSAFQPGPLMATYYSTKSYIYNLTMAIYHELKEKKSNVKISVLCPGPIDTNFNKRINAIFSVKALTSDYVTKYTLKKLEKNKLLIIPGMKMKIGVFITRLIPRKLLLKITYIIQRRKIKK